MYIKEAGNNIDLRSTMISSVYATCYQHFFLEISNCHMLLTYKFSGLEREIKGQSGMRIFVIETMIEPMKICNTLKMKHKETHAYHVLASFEHIHVQIAHD